MSSPRSKSNSNLNSKNDTNLLAQNLRDLNEISKRVINEYQEKNRILIGGLRDCKTCSMYIKKNQQSQI